MSELESNFTKASEEVTQLPKKPDNETLLQLYSLYKQGSKGDVEGSRPGLLNPVGRAKWDAWNKIKGKSKEAAMQEYVDLVEKLKTNS